MLSSDPFINDRFEDDKAQSKIEKMTRVWMNEKSCPDILFYEFSLMHTLQEYLERQVGPFVLPLLPDMPLTLLMYRLKRWMIILPMKIRCWFYL